MKHLIVFSHPNPASFCKAILDTRVSTLLNAGHEVKVTNIYEIDFNAILSSSDFVKMLQGDFADDVKEHQKDIIWADCITFIFPMWWGNAPAILRGYIDRVIAYGFAYKKDENGNIIGLLPGKKVELLVTTGSPLHVLEAEGVLESLRQNFKTNIIEFCGMEMTRLHFFGAVPAISNDERINMLKEVSEWN